MFVIIKFSLLPNSLLKLAYIVRTNLWIIHYLFFRIYEKRCHQNFLQSGGILKNLLETQALHCVRSQVARMLKCPEENVNYYCSERSECAIAPEQQSGLKTRYGHKFLHGKYQNSNEKRPPPLVIGQTKGGFKKVVLGFQIWLLGDCWRCEVHTADTCKESFYSCWCRAKQRVFCAQTKERGPL